MANENEVSTEVGTPEGGKTIFAPEVIATIANIAATEVEGVVSLSGGVVEELTGKLGKKSYTKGVKVELNNDETVVDMNIVVKYGFRIQDVCANIQRGVKNAIETMTGLKVLAVNIAVTAISVDKEKTEPAAEAKTDA